MLRMVPLPRFAGADKASRSRGAPERPRFAYATLKEFFPERKRKVQRREAPKPWPRHAGECCLARASGAARATGQSACANRLLRARCASRRSTAVSSPRRPARLGSKTTLAPSAGFKSAGGVLPSEILIRSICNSNEDNVKRRVTGVATKTPIPPTSSAPRNLA